jgi:hypothetical protein
VFYAYVIAPGHDPSHYDAHVQVAAPWSSIIAGAPIVFLIARWYARRRGPTDAVMIAVVYLAIDLVIVAGSGALLRLAPFVIASYATKLAAAWLGAHQLSSATRPMRSA